jgi:transposase-like protein
VERLNQELKRRTQVIRIFPNEAISFRLLRALAVEPGSASMSWRNDT